METVYVGCVELIVSMFPMEIIFSTMFTLIFWSDNSEAVRLSFFQKMPLRFEGFFCSSPWHKVGGLALCKSLRRTHFYEVKYSTLYFTWKLAEICAKILARMLSQ